MPDTAEAICRQVAGGCCAIESNCRAARIGSDCRRIRDVLQPIRGANVVYVLPGLATVIRSSDDGLRTIAGRTGHRKVRAAVIIDTNRRITLTGERIGNVPDGPGDAVVL